MNWPKRLSRLCQGAGFSATHGIVHAGFRGLRGFVAHTKSCCKLIRNRLVIPHDTIPLTVTAKQKKDTTP